jgi:hypothetical protein
MKLECYSLDVTGVVTKPLIRREAEKEWVEANNAGLIPPALYRFYSTASYFSFRSSPRFLSDPDRMLFPYVGALTRGVFESLCEADELSKRLRLPTGILTHQLSRLRSDRGTTRWEIKPSVTSGTLSLH